MGLGFRALIVFVTKKKKFPPPNIIGFCERPICLHYIILHPEPYSYNPTRPKESDVADEWGRAFADCCLSAAHIEAKKVLVKDLSLSGQGQGF